jgi:hypothetical protein
MEQGKKKQDCLRPLCGSQPTNPPRVSRSRNQQLNNNTTCCNTTVFPTPPGGTGHRVTAVIAWGKRPVPFRTRKLRPTAPMVLHPGGCGRVGHRRTTIRKTVESPNQPLVGALPHLSHQSDSAGPYARSRCPAEARLGLDDCDLRGWSGLARVRPGSKGVGLHRTQPRGGAARRHVVQHDGSRGCRRRPGVLGSPGECHVLPQAVPGGGDRHDVLLAGSRANNRRRRRSSAAGAGGDATGAVAGVEVTGAATSFGSVV